MPNKVNLFAPITKVETTADGGREIWGFATLERKDKTGEIADFERTVQAFQRWSDEVTKRTGGKSMGNVRVMHQPVPAGKMTHWEPGETEIELEDGTKQTVKGIWTATYVPPHKTDVIKDVDEGILSGLSIGGSYADRWWDEVEKGWRFAPELAEYSLVDNPAVPGADFANVVVKGIGPWNKPERNLAKAEDGNDDSEREKLHQEAEERAKKYGIQPKDGGHLTPPKGKPIDPEEYGDPTNYAYPTDDANIRAAVGYFNHEGMREKGGYGEEEWAVIGKRIADAANKLIGEGHEFKDGAIETSDARKEADKSAWGELQKRAGTGGELSHNDVRNLLNAAVNKGDPFGGDLWVCDVYDDYCIVEDWSENKNWKVPYTMKDGKAELGKPEEVVQTWQTVKGAEKSVDNSMQKSDPNDKAVSEKIAQLEEAINQLKAAQQKDEKASGASPEDKTVDEKIAAAEKVLAELKAAQAKDNKGDDKMDDEDVEKANQARDFLKSITDRLEKRGTAISAERQKHLRHAMDHIHKALGEDDKVQDKEHFGQKSSDDGIDAEKFAAAVVAKMEATVLQKSAPVDVGSVLTQALENAGLAKADVVSAVSEQLTKAVEQIATLEGLVKEIGEQPQSGGPFLGAYPGLGGAMPWQGVEKSILATALDRITDPVVKDQVGQSMATELFMAQMQARKPTA